MVISFLMSVLVVFIDQLTKFLVYGSPSRSIIGNLLWFESALNTGVAFSMFQIASGFFIFTSSLAVLIFAYLIASKKIVQVVVIAKHFMRTKNKRKSRLR